MPDWLLALIAAFAGLITGAVGARLVRSFMGSRSRPDFMRKIAAPVASLVFAFLLVAGLVTALGFVNEEALDRIPDDLVDYLPNALSALIVVIIGNVLATLTSAAVESALSRTGGNTRYQVSKLVKGVILVFAIILAAAQLGVDTTILNIVVAATLFSAGLAVALMIGFGTRNVATEVAAGRAVRRFVSIGDTITIDEVHGTVIGLDSVVVEVQTDSGVVAVPNGRLIAGPITLSRKTADSDAD